MLIATRCRKDFMNTLPPPCRESEVQERMTYAGGMYVEEAVAPKLNVICIQCPNWEPIHEKPGSRIFESCDIVDTTVCPHQEVNPRFGNYDGDIASFDDLCRCCRLFHPRQGVC